MKLLSGLLVLGLVFMAAPRSAEASTVGVDDIIVFDITPPGVVGELGVDKVGDGLGNLFHTFCLEFYEILVPGEQYRVNNVGPAAIAGGPDDDDPGNGLGSDPISDVTALLYAAFATGTLPDYPGSDHEAAANALQHAIWWLEDELREGWDTLGRDADPTGAKVALNTLSDLAQDYIAWATHADQADARAAALLSVQVVNIVTNDTAELLRQSVLQYNNPVPEPGSMFLLGSGLLGLGAAARRRLSRRQ